MNNITFDDSLSVLEQATETLKQSCIENNIDFEDEEYLTECSNQLEQNLEVFAEVENNNSNDKTTWESLKTFIKNIIAGIIYNFKQAIEELKFTILKHKKSINSSAYTKDFPTPIEVKNIAIENGRAKLKTVKVKNCLELERVTAASDKTIADKMAAKQKEELAIYTKYNKYVNDKASNKNLNESTNEVENIANTLLESIAISPVVETKEFPVQFTDDGDLLIKNYKKMDYNQEYQKSHDMIKTYDKSGSIEGIKYELARLWFINTVLTALVFDNPKIADDERKEFMKIRSWVMNDFVTYNKKVAKLEPKFNFSEYYNTTPFSDVYIKINSSTMKFMGNLLKNILGTIIK